MARFSFIILTAVISCFFNTLSADLKEGYPADYARAPRFRALFFYNSKAEPAHVDFARQAIDFFHRLSYGEGYILNVTDNLDSYCDSLDVYDVIIAANASPSSHKERKAFEKYMEDGGGWIGFHAAGYYDSNTKWDWYGQFLGAGPFYCNNWPPQPALVEVDNNKHSVTKNLPESFVVPECEWYQWNPGPRESENVEVLVTLSHKNYPLGIKDIIYYGDMPIVWTNKKYRMIYLNMGHGDREFSDAAQNLLFVNAFRWIVEPRLH